MTTSENLNRIIQAKSDIKSAIENKGVDVGDITIDGYADKIKQIKGQGKWVMAQGTTFGNSSFTEFNGDSIDVSNVTDMSNMFDGCNYVTSIDLSNWDTKKVFSMGKMFNGCSNLKYLKMGGDVSNVIQVTPMFYGVNTNGEFYYNEKYNYSKIIAELPDEWDAIPMKFD